MRILDQEWYESRDAIKMAFDERFTEAQQLTNAIMFGDFVKEKTNDVLLSRALHHMISPKNSDEVKSVLSDYIQLKSITLYRFLKPQQQHELMNEFAEFLRLKYLELNTK